MRVYKKAGTKERLFEMFENVNKIKLDENKTQLKETSGVFFDHILQGEEATEENARDHARGFDWSQVETSEGDYPHLQYVDSINGVGIYYNYGADSYYFTDETMEESFDSPIEKDEKYLDKTVGDETSQVSKYDDGTRYPVEDKLKVKDPSLEKLKGDDAPIQEKWDTDYETPKSERGKYDGKTQEELKSMLSSLKKSGPHHKGSPEYEKEKELMFALRAKHNFGKVSEDDQTVADEDEPINVGEEEPVDNDGGVEEKPAWDEDFGGEEEPEETEVEEPEMELDDIPAGDGAEASELDNEIEGDNLEPEMVDAIEEPAEDQIEGGLADDASPSDFCPIQIAKGIQIEMEHTDDPHKALEITMDHLTEIPDYYDRLEAMEAEAKEEGMESDEGAPEDSLLNPSKHWVDDYSPQNVSMGDDIDEAYPLEGGDPEAGEEEYEFDKKAKNGEFNDLDAEEDEDWNKRIKSGQMKPIN